jgi:hypothetical protein
MIGVSLSLGALVIVPAVAGSTATIAAERAALAVRQHHARADLVHQRQIARHNGVVGDEPARHLLLHVVLVGLYRELAAGEHLALGRVGVPRAGALADAEALERILEGQKGRLPLPHVGGGKARAPALDRIGYVHVPALADEHVEPAVAAVGRALVGDAGEPAAVP